MKDVKDLINLEHDQTQVNKEQTFRIEIELNQLEQEIDESNEKNEDLFKQISRNDQEI